MILFRSSPGAAQEPGPPAAGDTAAGAEENVVVVKVEGAYQGKLGPEPDPRLLPDETRSAYLTRFHLNLAEAVQTFPGVEMEELGGDEGPWFLRVRGWGEDDLAVYLDGILLSDPLGRPVDFSRFPMGLVEQAALYRGGAPAGYPVEAAGGVIELDMLAPGDRMRVRAGAEGDSWGTVQVSAAISGKALRGEGAAGVSFQGGPARFPYQDTRGTFFHEGDDREESRHHNRFSDYDVLLKWRGKAGRTRVYGGGYYQQRHHELPGPGYAPADDASSGSELVVGYAGFRRAGFISPDLDAEVRVHALQERTRLKDKQGELGPQRDESNLRTRSAADLFLNYYGLPGNKLALSFSLYEDKYHPDSELDKRVQKISMSRSALYLTAADHLSLLDGRLLLRPGIHYGYEGNSYHGKTLAVQADAAKETTSNSFTSLDLAVEMRIAPGLLLHLYGGQHYRTPGLLEEFGDRVNLMGNPDLNAERGIIREGALIYGPKTARGVESFHAQIRVFEQTLYNQIGWAAQPGGLLLADNVGDVRSSGVELALELETEDSLYGKFSYAFLETKNRTGDRATDGNASTLAPRNRAAILLLYPLGDFSFYYKSFYKDVAYLDLENRIRTGPRFTHTLGAAWEKKGFRAGLEARNITGDQEREALDYPLPGTSFVLFAGYEGTRLTSR